MRKLLLFLFIPFAFISCAKNYYTSYSPNTADKEFGSVIVKFSNPVQNVNATINGNLIAEDKFTKRIEVDSLPAGEHEIKVIASSWELKRDINKLENVHVEPHTKRTMLVEVPPKSTGYWIYQTAAFMVSFIASYWIYH
ncbi:hypothetical protein [Gracilimonas tropica]|uniref:hypothetical protein n=1 Tax=Gracilimonas tropica TaxID=454600 RepID=UPI0003812313|nr:hypothetical protein [Gracilimonas tropica]